MKKVLDNFIILIIGVLALCWIVINTCTFFVIPKLLSYVNRRTKKEIEKQVQAYLSLGNPEDFNIKVNYAFELKKINTISAECAKILESIKLQGNKATENQKQLLIDSIEELENAMFC